VIALHRIFPILTHANLANAITAANALLGVMGIYFAARGLPAPALFCAALAMPCDVLDGVIARKTGTTSAFGAQLDTLADALSFVVLPAAIAMAFHLPVYVLLAALFYSLAGLLRLARFGVVGLTPSGGVECFEGVPSIFAACALQILVAMTLWISPRVQALSMSAFYVIFGLAMVSGLPFPKRGLHTRLMWVSVPIAFVATWIKLS